MKNLNKIMALMLFVLITSASFFPTLQTSAATRKFIVNGTMEYTLDIGEKLSLTVKTNSTIKWSTSNSKVATVSGSGVVIGKEKGKATITATVGNIKYYCYIVVRNYEEDLNYLKEISERDNIDRSSIPTLDNNTNITKGLEKAITIETGQKYTLKLIDIKGTAKWSSSNKSIVTVSEKGKITGIKKGKATITAVVNNKKYSCKVTVIESEEDIAAREKAEEEKIKKRIKEMLESGSAVSYDATDEE